MLNRMQSEHVSIFEVGPRDGLQNEVRWIETSDKVHLINHLTAAGLQRIEVTGFVSPKWVPQMADAANVLHGIDRSADTRYSALTPNIKGYLAARAAQVDEVAIFASASEAFSQNNINCSIHESLARFRPVLEAAKNDKLPVRGYISCITDCPFSGPIPPDSVAVLTQELLQMGCYEVSLGDTIGQATPATISEMLRAVLQIAAPDQLAGHYHDTNGLAVPNIRTSLAMGIRTFDSAVGGLGGCPYAPGSRGNVATEKVIECVEEQGFITNVNQSKLEVARKFARSLVNLSEQ